MTEAKAVTSMGQRAQAAREAYQQRAGRMPEDMRAGLLKTWESARGNIMNALTAAVRNGDSATVTLDTPDGTAQVRIIGALGTLRNGWELSYADKPGAPCHHRLDIEHIRTITATPSIS